ncbi:unnamed protein product [Chondrus crispus]|uniref:Uncharacterized protein n=1 Tax=Chondrus crispus TaxID=2769 RepID=R7QC13_CHOCR|nr:unnamed protein product [Chondrus crispus]CDF35338.1 unnamed protein product [Chondrus crispus]|eukprot:XP_005715157.1 unnamed protein product [Chondrus crispus]
MALFSDSSCAFACTVTCSNAASCSALRRMAWFSSAAAWPLRRDSSCARAASSAVDEEFFERASASTWRSLLSAASMASCAAFSLVSSWRCLLLAACSLASVAEALTLSSSSSASRSLMVVFSVRTTFSLSAILMDSFSPSFRMAVICLSFSLTSSASPARESRTRRNESRSRVSAYTLRSLVTTRDRASLSWARNSATSTSASLAACGLGTGRLRSPSDLASGLPFCSSAGCWWSS